MAATRDILTVMFTDIEGSTAMRTGLGDDEANVRHGVHDTVVARCVGHDGGRVVKSTGDGALVTFTSARAAVRCAIAIQRALRDLAAERPVPRVRIGCNAGEVDVADDGDVFGQAVNGAARVAAVGDGGEIVVSDVVRSLVGHQPDLDFVELGSFELAGFAEPWRLHSVPWDEPGVAERSITLLGDVAVRLRERRIEEAASPRALLLLAAAALARGMPVDRGRLAFRLWPDSTDQQARTNLRKVLHELRTWLPDDEEWLEVDQRRIRLRAEQVEVDVSRFLAAVERDDHSAAADAYTGDLLPGYWDDWVVEERDRLRRHAVGAYRASIDAADAENDLDAVVARAQRLISFDPLEELAYRALMGAQLALGNRAAAVRAFHQCTAVLERELGVEPTADTLALYDEIRRGGTQRAGRATPIESDRAAAAAGAPVRASTVPADLRSTTSVPFLGRGAELDWVEAAWRRALADGPRATLITGDAGIGKSRLADELALRCARQGVTVLRSRAYETDRGRMLAPVVDWLRDGRVLEACRSLGPDRRRELRRLLPELGAGAPDAETDPADARSLLFEAAVDALRAAGAPLLLVLDDVQWCGRDTVDFAAHLLHRPPTNELLVVLTRRDFEPPLDDDLDVKLAGLRGEGRLDELPLARVGPDVTAEIAAAVTGDALDAATAARLHAGADGHPLFIIEAARAGLSDESGVATSTMHGVIQRRLGQLGDEQRTLLEVAAVIGRRFELEVLSRAAERDEDDLIDDVDELWRRGILGETATGFDFTHDRLREVVADGVSPARARRLHRKIAEALAETSGAAVDQVAAELADHFEAAGLDEEAIGALGRAASRATNIGAHRDAITLLERALELLKRQPPGAGREVRELALLTDLGAALVVCAGYGDEYAQRTWTQAAGLSRRLGTTLSAPVLRGLALAAIADCRFPRAIGFGEDLRALDEPVAVVEGEYVLGVTRFWQGRFDEADRHLRAAIDRYDPSRSPDHRRLFSQDPKAVCLSRLAYLRLLQAHGREADELMVHAEQLARELDDPLTAAYVWTYRQILDRAAGAGPGPDPPVADAGFFAASHAGARAWAAARRGDPDGLARVADVVDQWRQDGHTLHLTMWLGLQADLLLDVGDLDGAERAVAEALRFTVERGQRYLEPDLLRSSARRQRLAGDLEAAARAATEARDLARRMGARAFELRAGSELLRCCPDDAALRSALTALVDELADVHLGVDLDEARSTLAETA